MYSTKLLPDFTKLNNYFANIADELLEQIKGNGGVEINLDYLDEVSFINVSEGLKVICEKYNLREHYDELLYLTIRKNEEVRIKYVALWDNYHTDQNSKELAQFLLSFKDSKPNQPFQLVTKSFTGSAAIKSNPLARWMAELIYKAIEKQEFPLGMIGGKVLKDLFGDNPFFVDEIPMERLKATAAISPRKPTTKLKRLYVEFCLYLQTYLINQSHLTLPENVMLTDAHANFFFDILELLGYIDSEQIESEPKDYIHTMFRNQSR